MNMTKNRTKNRLRQKPLLGSANFTGANLSDVEGLERPNADNPWQRENSASNAPDACP
jgi:hypothetical protein